MFTFPFTWYGLSSAEKCQDWALATPRNGKKECKRKAGGNGWDCKLTCDSNTFFYNGEDTENTENTNTLKTEMTFSCNDNGDWSPATAVTDCIGEGGHIIINNIDNFINLRYVHVCIHIYALTL